MNITIFKGQKIERLNVCPSDMANLQCQGDEAYIEGHYHWDEYYIQDGQPVLRPDTPATISADVVPADGESAVILQAVAGTLTVGRETYEVEAGPVELTFGTPGEYRIQLEAFPYLPFEAVIHAY